MMIWDNFYFLHTILQALEYTQEFFPSVVPCTAMGKVKGKNLIFNQKKNIQFEGLQNLSDSFILWTL